MRILRLILMVLAVFSMMGQPASAIGITHVETVATHSVQTSDHPGAAAVHSIAAVDHHGHPCPFHHHGKCSDCSCCASTCLSPLGGTLPGVVQATHASCVAIPFRDERPDGTILGLADRPPIAT